MIKSTILMTMFLYALTNNVLAHDVWVPYTPAPVLMPPVVQVPKIPSVTYSTSPQPMPIVYGWVPYRVNKAVIVEKRCMFHRYQYIEYQPTIEWVYQPVYR